jgi:tetratricopeptide (TPR) repeat protein
LADFEAAVVADPDFRQAYENQAAVLAEHLGRPADAVAALDRAVERFPTYTLARSGRAVLLARLGRAGDARRDADAAVASDPSPLICYQAGCAYLLTAAGPADRAAGLALLRRALRQDPSWAKHMPADPDLKAVRDAAEFRKLIQAAGELLRDGPAAR